MTHAESSPAPVPAPAAAPVAPEILVAPVASAAPVADTLPSLRETPRPSTSKQSPAKPARLSSEYACTA